MSTRHEPSHRPGGPNGPPRLLITAGPTHEPIDAVRYLANRSSGRLGVALAEHAAAHGWAVTLLLGPTPRVCSDTRVEVHRFRTTADLQALLHDHFHTCDALIMAAAVADYRATATPGVDPAASKLRRDPASLTLELEPTPDLLAGCAARRRPGQLLCGFALEPSDRLLSSAADKLARKGLDLIVANPLETMDAPDIEATVLTASGQRLQPGRIDKEGFAAWLLDRLAERLAAPAASGNGRAPDPQP